MLHKPITPFPILFPDTPEAWQWPAPPFAWRHRPAPGVDDAQPCLVESQAGEVRGEMLGFDAAARTLRFRSGPDGPAATLSFARMRRLTLTTPLQPALQIAGAPVERVPSAAQEREYRLQSEGTAPPLTGRTAGHVETADGMYLFTPVDEEASVQRVFVPRSAYTRCEFGASAEEVAARRWISTPTDLLAAIERQQRMPVLRLGQSLLALGLITQAQLDRALARPHPTLPLGESLVAQGLIGEGDLQTALAHKMGFPLVDLMHFPIDPTAVARLPHRIAAGYCTVPLMLDGERLVVAVDRPSRVNKLRMLRAYAESSVVPVLACRVQIVLALERLSDDVWNRHVAAAPGFFATTI